MKRRTEQLFAKGEDAIEAAELLLRSGKKDFAAGRAYYNTLLKILSRITEPTKGYAAIHARAGFVRAVGDACALN